MLTFRLIKLQKSLVVPHSQGSSETAAKREKLLNELAEIRTEKQKIFDRKRSNDEELKALNKQVAEKVQANSIFVYNKNVAQYMSRPALRRRVQPQSLLFTISSAIWESSTPIN